MFNIFWQWKNVLFLFTEKKTVNCIHSCEYKTATEKEQLFITCFFNFRVFFRLDLTVLIKTYTFHAPNMYLFEKNSTNYIFNQETVKMLISTIDLTWYFILFFRCLSFLNSNIAIIPAITITWNWNIFLMSWIFWYFFEFSTRRIQDVHT